MKAIFASDESRGFGYMGRVPWPKLKEDMEHFRKITCNNLILMAKSTWKTLPTLPYRTPILITDNPVEDREDLLQISRSHLLHRAEEFDTYAKGLLGKEAIIIGGTSILTPEYLKLCEEIHHTQVKGYFDADVLISQETLDYLNTLPSEVIIENDKMIIRKYSNESV